MITTALEAKQCLLWLAMASRESKAEASRTRSRKRLGDATAAPKQAIPSGSGLKKSTAPAGRETGGVLKSVLKTPPAIHRPRRKKEEVEAKGKGKGKGGGKGGGKGNGKGGDDEEVRKLRANAKRLEEENRNLKQAAKDVNDDGGGSEEEDEEMDAECNEFTCE